MMGCNSASSQLPNAPTSSELAAWDTWQERAQEDLSKHIQTKIYGATTAAQQRFVEHQELTTIRCSRQTTNFTPAAHVFSIPLISTWVKTDCNKEFEDRGFPCITFKWNSPTLSGSDWNNTTASILLEHWTRWYQGQAQEQTSASIHSTAIADRWLETMQKRYQIERMLFKKNPMFSSLFKDTELGSDREENSSNPSAPPNQIIPAWRSDLLSEIITHLNEAAIQLAKTRKNQIALLHLLQHGTSCYEDRKPEDLDLMPVPSKLPEAAYAEEYLLTLSTLEKQKLKMKKNSSTGYVNLEKIYVLLRKLTLKPLPEESQLAQPLPDGPGNVNQLAQPLADGPGNVMEDDGMEDLFTASYYAP
ncbi:hypothetical protein VP01_1166g5 [Puccinia sorghi]|uniref:Uncharacterized protein n=1 Tax=Puccinia sorghi TaxID=27349 RepID=A0A0L6VRK6_9BASI|nr:hypothetical protein VP01_1166g5 [Puccinia sorghi]